jgi:hypothetical protein
MNGNARLSITDISGTSTQKLKICHWIMKDTLK